MQRQLQEEATATLSALMRATDLPQEVVERREELSEGFFLVASTYLQMAQQEKNQEVADLLSNILEAAFQEKQKMLRPEIR